MTTVNSPIVFYTRRLGDHVYFQFEQKLEILIPEYPVSKKVDSVKYLPV